jgi:hypothetical protein
MNGGSGGGTRTPDTRIMIEASLPDYSPRPAPSCISKTLLRRSFLILARLTSPQGATPNHTHLRHPGVTHAIMAPRRNFGLFLSCD